MKASNEYLMIRAIARIEKKHNINLKIWNSFIISAIKIRIMLIRNILILILSNSFFNFFVFLFFFIFISPSKSIINSNKKSHKL